MDQSTPIYGTLQIDKKAVNSIRLFSVDVSRLSFWLNGNYKTKKLKHVLKQYKVDSMDLQEVCVNWANIKTTRSIAELQR